MTIDRVTQRLYRGVCTERELVVRALRKVREHEAEILQVLRDIPGLTEDSVATGIKFLSGFFNQASDEAKLLRSFERRCI